MIMMSRKLTVLIILVLMTHVPVSAKTDTYRPNDSTGAPENNRDSLYITEDGDIRDFSLSIPLINDEFDVISAIAFRDVNISRFTQINEANLSLNFQLDFQESPLSLMVTVYGFSDDLKNDTFKSFSLSIPVTQHMVNVDLQNVTSPGYYVIDVTEIVHEIINKEWWNSGDTLGLIIFAESRNRARSYQSNYGINRPKLTIRYGEFDYDPGPETSYIGHYKGYDIHFGAYGNRVVIAEDDSGDDWIFTLSNTTGTMQTLNYSLPFEPPIYSYVQDTAICIGTDVWCLGVSGTSLSLYKSENAGETWSNMHTFTTGNAVDVGKMEYSPSKELIYIMGFNWAGNRYFFMSYNISGDCTDLAPYTFHQAQYGIGDMDFTVDENDDIWSGLTCGGNWGSEKRLVARKRVSGVWSAKEYFDAYDAGAGDPMWRYVDVHHAWDVPNNNKTIVYVVALSDLVFVDRISRTAPLSDLGFSDGEWQYGEVIDLSRDASVGANVFKSAVQPRNDIDDPYDAYFDLGVIYRDQRWGYHIPVTVSVNFPYPSISTYADSNVTNDHQYTGIYVDPFGEFRVLSQHIVNRKYVYECGLAWFHKTRKVYEWQAIRLFTHHENIQTYTVPTHPFSNPSYFIYDGNGTLIKVLSGDEYDNETVIDYIDNELIDGGSIEDPSPGGWEDEGPFRRSRLRLYFFFMGWGCFWLPWFYVGYAKGIEKIMSFWVAVLISVIGLALLWAIPGI